MKGAVKMRKTGLFLLLAFVAFLVWTSSCQSPSSTDQPVASPLAKSNSESNSSGSTSKASFGFLRVILKDKPISEAQNVFVTIDKVSVHKECEEPEDCDFIDIYTNPEGLKIDLLALKNTPSTLVTATLETGKYNQIRLSVLSGEIVFPPPSPEDEAVPFTLQVPSGKIKIPVHFEITAEGETDIILDFDAEKSIHIVQKGKSDTYILRPVIHVEGIQ
jgi:hypothetical protein